MPEATASSSRFPPRKATNYTYKGKTTPTTIENTAPGVNTLQGQLGESPFRLDVESRLGAIGISGQAGDVAVDETITLNPAAIMFGGALMTSEGTIGGLEYEEKFYLADNNTMVSKGHLGEMEINRVFSEDENENKIIQGNIGDTEIDECIVFNPQEEKRAKAA